MSNTNDRSSTKAGWRVDEFSRDTGIRRSTVFILIAEQAVRSIKVGRARIILTPPREYLESLAGSQ